ncbi:MAG: histidine phosphatase family protein [Myxococcota bacterium]
MLTIYLARHGQTDWNKARRLQGWTDIPLNRTGEAQAAQLAERLASARLDAIYTSPLTRAKTTAAALTGRASITEVAGLRERCMGAFEGVFLDGRDLEREGVFKARKHAPGDDLDGGEAVEAFQRRVNETISEIVSAHTNGAILVVGHGATNSMVLGRFMGLELSGIARLWIANDDLFRIETEDGAIGRVWKEITPALVSRANGLSAVR